LSGECSIPGRNHNAVDSQITGLVDYAPGNRFQGLFLCFTYQENKKEYTRNGLLHMAFLYKDKIWWLKMMIPDYVFTRLK